MLYMASIVIWIETWTVKKQILKEQQQICGFGEEPLKYHKDSKEEVLPRMKTKRKLMEISRKSRFLGHVMVEHVESIYLSGKF